jgi:DNA-binding CsgD family transcriptional regulator
MLNENSSYYTPKVVSSLPADPNSPEFQHFKKVIKRFPEEAIYIYSMKENRMLFTAGWKETLGYDDDKINLQTIVSQTDPAHAPFTYDINDKAVRFLASPREDIEDYSFTFETRKIHKNGSLVPMEIKIGVYSGENGMIREAIGRFQVNRSLRFGKVIRYSAFGPEKSEFEDELNKSLFNYQTISGKEKEALVYLAKGYTFKEIADELNITSSAVEKRILPLYKRFEVKSLAHLISFAYENFILP